MGKEVSSKNIERFDYEQGYENAFIAHLKELGIKHIYEPDSETGKHNAYFINLMSSARCFLKKEIAHRKISTQLELEELVKEPDNFISEAEKNKELWKFPEVKSAWHDYKRNYLQEILKKTKDSKNKNSALLRSLGLSLAKLAIYGAVTGAAAAAGIWAVYEYHIKPDIKREIRDNMPYVPTLEEMKTVLLKEVRDNQNETVDQILDKAEKRYPLLEGMKISPEFEEKK